MYKILTDRNKPCGIQRLSDNTIIPFDSNNTDYQVYLKWVEEGNTAEQADENPSE